jgi:tetratricopeptide (TPR) repeat protein
LSGWCLSSSAIPYFPFVEAFDSFESGKEIEEATQAQLLQIRNHLTGPGNLGVANENLSRQAWKDQTFASVTKELLFISTIRPLVVFIDDIHWADSASLSLLQYLARAINHERILILATIRNEELNIQLEKQARQLEEILRIMRREDLYEPINLSNLSPVEVGKISESMLGGKVNLRLVDRIFAETQGNPLFVVEYMKMFAEHEMLTKEQNSWTAPEDQFGVPAKVKDVILRRVNALSSEDRSVLDAGAVLGENFDGELIGSILEQSTTKVLGTLNTICKTNSLVCSEQYYFRFDHPKTREVLYEELSPPLRKHYHLRAAEKLETSTNNTRGLLADLAHHYVQGGNKEKAIKYSLEAGKEALAHFGNAEAIKHFNYVLQTIENNPAYPFEKTVALEGLGDSLYANAMFKEATKTYKVLAEIGGPTKIRALRKAMDSAFFQNDIPKLRVLLQEAENCDAYDRLEHARIIMNKARMTSKEPGQILKSIEYFEQALKLAEENYSTWDTAWILIGYGATLPWTGQLEKATTALLRAITLFHELNDSRWLIEAYNIAGDICIAHTGQLNEGIDFLKKAVAVNEEAKVSEYMRLSQVNAEWARALGAQQDLKGALSKSLESLRYSEKTDSNWAKGMAYANLTTYYSILEDTKNAEKYFSKLTSLPPETLKNTYVGATLATAFFYAATKQWGKSAHIFNRMIEGFKTIPTPGIEAMIRLCYAGVLEKKDQNEQAHNQKQQAQKLYEGINKRFEGAELQTSLMAPATVTVNQEFETRLDLINVSKNQRTIVDIKNILPEELKVTSISPGAQFKAGEIKFDDQTLHPLSVKSIKLSAQAAKAGHFTLNLQVHYIDDLGASKTAYVRTVKITVSPSRAQTEIEINSSPTQKETEFKSEAAQKIFEYLVKAFREDYLQKKMPQERSGWRSLMDLVKQAKVSRYSVYGFPSSQGQAMAELQHSGFVELRVFEGERGRGGKIAKTRICYEKENVKPHINNSQKTT